MNFNMYSSGFGGIKSKLIIMFIEIILIYISYLILFGNGIALHQHNLNIHNEVKITLFLFNIITFLRFMFTLFVFLKRQIPLGEAFAVPLAFAIYYIGFPIIAIFNLHKFDYIDIIGVLLFLLGSFINTFSEFQRMLFKKNIKNKGKIYTKGLFTYVRHVNFLGDVIWVLGYSLVARGIVGYAIVILLLLFFIFFNIPKLEKHLLTKYKDDFKDWMKKSKRIIPGIY